MRIHAAINERTLRRTLQGTQTRKARPHRPRQGSARLRLQDRGRRTRPFFVRAVRKLGAADVILGTAGEITAAEAREKANAVKARTGLAGKLANLLAGGGHDRAIAAIEHIHYLREQLIEAVGHNRLTEDFGRVLRVLVARRYVLGFLRSRPRNSPDDVVERLLGRHSELHERCNRRFAERYKDPCLVDIGIITRPFLLLCETFASGPQVQMGSR